MFTGIIEELGKVTSIKKTDTGKQFQISAKVVMDDLKQGDSIAVNGVCLTAVEINEKGFKVDLVHETLNKSNLNELKNNSLVNLERALTLSTRLGGHMIQGHVETVGVILEKTPDGDGATIVVGVNPEWMRYCIPKGSIALDGISLTIADIEDNFISIALIPHTLEKTTLGFKEAGDTLNIETDIVGKYIERLLSFEDEEMENDSAGQKFLKFNFGES